MKGMANTTRQRALVGKLLESKGSISIYKAMTAVGYSHNYSRSSTKVTQSKSFQDLLEEMLPDDELVRVHAKLLRSKKLEHMDFPLDVTDEEIAWLIKDMGGMLRNIKHGKAAKQVFWWADNHLSQLPALALAYKVKGRLTPSQGTTPVNAYDAFVQNNQLDPNGLQGKAIADKTLEVMMELTKRTPLAVESAQEGQTR
jgi:hypothetical protein